MKATLFVILSVSLVSAWSGPGVTWADETEPRSSPSFAVGESAPLDPSFLLLPSFDFASAPSTAKVGDLLRLELSGLPAIEPGQSYAVQLPAGNSPLNDQGWEVSAGKSEPGKLTVTVVPIKAGKLSLPSLAIGTGGGKGTEFKALARTNPVSVQVQSSIRSDDPKPTEPVAPKPPAELAFPWWVIAVGGIMLVVLVVGAVYALVRWSRRSAAAVAKPVEPPRPEDEVALSELAALERSGVLEKGDFKLYYFRISEILKRYVGERYRFDALESTTREMIFAMPEFARQHGGALESIFAKLDLVKFTDHVPVQAEASALVGDARKFVLETRRKPIPLETPPAQGAAKGGGP